MEQNKVLCCALISVAVLALVFQGVGLFSPAWLRISAKIDMNALSGGSQTASQNGGSPNGLSRPSEPGMDNIGQSPSSDSKDGPTNMNSWDNSAKSMSSGVESGFSGPVKSESKSEDFYGGGEEIGNAFSDMTGTMETETNFGLWTGSECIKTNVITKCVDLDELQSAAASGANNLGNLSLKAILSGLHKCSVLASLGFVAAIAGCVVMFVLLRSDNITKIKGIIGASLWGLSVIFTLAAVAMQAQQNSTYDKSFEVIKAVPMLNGLDLQFPLAWSLLMSGLGCLFAGVAGVMIAVAACYLPTQNETWSRFHNQAV